MNVSTNRIRIIPWLAVVVVAASIALACAPASSGVGSDVGDAVPPFAMQLADGTQVSSETLDAADRPTHLFYFATW